MIRSLRTFAILVLGLGLATPVAAQEETTQVEPHAVTGEEIDALLADHVRTDREARSQVRAFLQRAEVRRVASDAGLDIRTAESAVASLDDAEARALADRVDRLDETLAGANDAIVISTTTLIIALLVLIIILVA